MNRHIVVSGILFALFCNSGFADEISSKKNCEALGGHWGTFGLMVHEQCNLPTPDAGKECTDSDQCKSACITNHISYEKFKKLGFCSGPRYKGKPCQGVVDCGGSEVCVIEFEKIPGKGFCYGWTVLVGTCQNYVEDAMISSPLCLD